MSIGKKHCPDCGEIKPATAKYFHRNRKMADRLESKCKKCRNAIEQLRYYNSRYGKVPLCENCYFEFICRANIWNMFWWPYCMRKE